MNEVIKLELKIVPELIDVFEKRYNILRNILYNEPIGRRVLASKLGIGERIVRTEINFLKSQNLIEVHASGMNVTNEGKEILEKLKDFIYTIKGLDDIEKYIKKSLKLEDVIIVPGNIEEEPSIMNELGKAGAKYINKKIKDNYILSLTGGTSVKSIVDNMGVLSKAKNVLVLPARGGMGRNLETQSNTLAARLAEKINANYGLLHVPDDLSDNALNAMMQEKNISKTVEKIRKSNMLIFGIGKASDMAVKRGMPEDEIKKLIKDGAVAEAFGYYFDSKGNIIHFNPTIGIRREDINNIETSVAIAGGKSKARAILSVELNMHSKTLIIDEGAAREIMNILQNKK